MKDHCYLFKGWFFGKTAGLLGTLDSEPATDFLASDGHIQDNPNSFIDSWSLQNCISKSDISKKEDNPENTEMCKSLYQMKTSSFSACYPIVSNKRSFPQHSMKMAEK